MNVIEKNEKKLRKQRYILMLLLCAVMVTGATIAYTTAWAGERINPFTFGNTEVTVEENFKGWTAKKVQLEAGGDIPCIVRAMIVPVFKNASDDVEGAIGNSGVLSAPSGNTIVMGDITFELDADWSTNWFYQDGYFYFRRVMQPGEQTTLLLSKVSLTTDNDAMREKYADIQIEVEVLAESLQAEGGASEDAWNVKVSSGIVLPGP